MDIRSFAHWLPFDHGAMPLEVRVRQASSRCELFIYVKKMLQKPACIWSFLLETGSVALTTHLCNIYNNSYIPKRTGIIDLC